MGADAEKELDALQTAVTKLDHALFGVMGDNGLVTEVRELRARFFAFVDAARQEKIDKAQDDRRRDRTLMLAAVSAVIGMLGVVVTLVLFIAQTGGPS